MATDCQADCWAGGGRGRGGGEGAPGLDGAGQLPKRFGAARTRYGEQRVLPGEELSGPGEFQQDPGGGAEFCVLPAGQGAAHGEGRVDHAGVDLVGGLGGGAASGDVLAGGFQRLGVDDERAQADHDVRTVVAGVGDGVALSEPQPPDGGVGAAGLLVQGGRVGAGVGEEADGGAPFGLELGDGGGDGGAYLGVDLLDAAEPGDVLGSADGGEGPQGEQRDDGDHQQ